MYGCWLPQLVVAYVGQCQCNAKATTSKVSGETRECYRFHCSRSLKCFYYALLPYAQYVSSGLCDLCLFLGPEPQGRAGYPPVAPKPVMRMATGGAGPEEAGQGSPVVMKKMVPVQSSRPQPAASTNMTQQGENKTKSFAHGFIERTTPSGVISCRLRQLNVVVGSVTGDGGAYSSGAVPPEQRAPPAVREDRRQPTAYNAPPARQQPPPAEEEEEANDYDSDEASEYTICSPFS